MGEEHNSFARTPSSGSSNATLEEYFLYFTFFTFILFLIRCLDLDRCFPTSVALFEELSHKGSILCSSIKRRMDFLKTFPCWKNCPFSASYQAVNFYAIFTI